MNLKKIMCLSMLYSHSAFAGFSFNDGITGQVKVARIQIGDRIGTNTFKDSIQFGNTSTVPTAPYITDFTVFLKRGVGSWTGKGLNTTPDGQCHDTTELEFPVSFNYYDSKWEKAHKLYEILEKAMYTGATIEYLNFGAGMVVDTTKTGTNNCTLKASTASTAYISGIRISSTPT